MEEQWLILIKLMKIKFHHIQKDITNFDNYINVHLHTNSNYYRQLSQMCIISIIIAYIWACIKYHMGGGGLRLPFVYGGGGGGGGHCSK